LLCYSRIKFPYSNLSISYLSTSYRWNQFNLICYIHYNEFYFPFSFSTLLCIFIASYQICSKKKYIYWCSKLIYRLSIITNQKHRNRGERSKNVENDFRFWEVSSYRQCLQKRCLNLNVKINCVCHVVWGRDWFWIFLWNLKKQTLGKMELIGFWTAMKCI